MIQELSQQYRIKEHNGFFKIEKLITQIELEANILTFFSIRKPKEIKKQIWASGLKFYDVYNFKGTSTYLFETFNTLEECKEFLKEVIRIDSLADGKPKYHYL